MTEENSNMIKKETMLLVALGALVIGFLGGIVFTAYKAPSSPPAVSTPQPPQQAAQQFNQQQAQQILALEQSLKANPKNGQGWVELGNLYYDINQPPKAIEAYNKALQLISPDPNILTDLGVMYRRNGQPKEAIESFKKAASLSPSHEQSRFNMGVVYLHDLNDKKDALKAWQELLAINPGAMAPDGKTVQEMVKELQQGN